MIRPGRTDCADATDDWSTVWVCVVVLIIETNVISPVRRCNP
jgi:hypothetical protein